jgi:ornithine cyclodeaminase/alanine dehydrogenase-like protein (mu-crystallin family)
MRSNRVDRVLVLGYDEVSRLLPMTECIEVMEEALASLARGEMAMPLRFVFSPPGADGLMGLMPSYRGGERPAFALKAINVIPDNPRLRGLDAHQGGVLLSDGESGEPTAFLNASAITEIRTAAVSAVATRALAREDARELAILGAGVQARSHLEAMRAVRRFDRVRIFSPTAEHARRLAEDEGAEAVERAEDAVREADVVVTATSSPEPVLRRDWLKPGAHVNAVGGRPPVMRELDTATVAGSAFFVDRRESAESEAGDYIAARDEGTIGPDHIRAELGEVLIGARPGRTSPDELTVFRSLGLAIEDLAAADHVVRRARTEGVGADVPF